PLLADDRPLREVVGDDDSGVGEDLAAGDVVGVVVAVDHVPNGLVEALLDLVLQPAGRVGVDRIGRDHSGGRHREHRVVGVVPEPVDLAGDLRDLPHRRLRRLLLGERHGGWQQRQHRDDDGQRERLHTASLTAVTAAGFSSDERSPGSRPRYVARITRRMILALRVFGRSRVNNTRSGLSALPIWRATRSDSSLRSASEGRWRGRSTTKQTMASPFTSCGTPTTPASATATCETSTDSTSAGPSRLPAIFNVSSERPWMNQNPSSST